MFSPSHLLTLLAAVIVLAVFLRIVAARRGHDPIMMFDGDAEEAMIEAIAEAKRTLPDFLAVLAHPQGASEFGFKYQIAGWEHVWVEDVERRSDNLAGRLANEPAEPGYARGDPTVVPLADVVDWTYRDTGGVVQGQHTTRVMLDRADPKEAAKMRRYNGWKD